MRRILFLICLLCSVGCHAGTTNGVATRNTEDAVNYTIAITITVPKNDSIVNVQECFQKKDMRLYGEVSGKKNYEGQSLTKLLVNPEQANLIDNMVVEFNCDSVLSSLLISLNFDNWKNSLDTLNVYFPLEDVENKKSPHENKRFLLRLVKGTTELKASNVEEETDSVAVENDSVKNNIQNSFFNVNECLHKWLPFVLLFFVFLLFSVYLRINKIKNTLNKLEKTNNPEKDKFADRLSKIEKYLLAQKQKRGTLDDSFKNEDLSKIKEEVEELKCSVGLLKEKVSTVKKEVIQDDYPSSETPKPEVIFDTTDVEYSNEQFLIIKDNPNYRLFRIYSKDKMFFYSLADEKNPDFRHQILDILNVIAGAVEVVNSVTSAREVCVSQPGKLYKVDDTTFRIVKKMQVDLV